MKITFEQTIRKAIEIEDDLIQFYSEKIEVSEYPGSKKLLKYLIDQKTSHKEFYEAYLSKYDELGGYCSMPLDFMDYQITDNLVEQRLTEKSKIQDILIFAAQQEQRIHDYYIALSKEYKDTEIGYIWECFARESLFHKEYFETEYDYTILKEM
jgi:hypothetical protein